MAALPTRYARNLCLAAMVLCAWPGCGDEPVGGPACDVPEDASFRVQRDSVSNRPMRWPAPVCIDLAVAETGLKGLAIEEVLDGVALAAAIWTEPECADICFATTGTAPPSTFGYRAGDETNQTLLYWISDRIDWTSRHSESVVAVTTIVTEALTGRILDADIELNDLGRYSWTVDERAPSADVVTIVAHELGHALGLDHAVDGESLMSPGWQPGWMRRALSPGDRAGICFLYGCP